MRRRDFLAWLPLSGFVIASPARAASETMQRPPPATQREVDVKADFGARGDGVTDDWQAIENAGRYLEARGGGRMYFPAGRYLLPTFGRNIEVRNFIEYCGDGASSVIIGSNAGFTSPHGASFGRGSYPKYSYFQARDIVAGALSVTLAVAADGGKFSPGDIIVARSVTAVASTGDVLPHFVEMNRVISVHGGVITLEDPIDDGWSGVMVARVTGDVAQGYSIHDLRIECEAGYPIFIQASYKSVIRNCWTLGVSVITVNGFSRSVAHDIIATVLWSGSPMASLIEIETGSVRASLHSMEIEVYGASLAAGGFPLFYCQEFSRRTQVSNIRVAASSIAAGIVISAFAGGHSFENIEIVARSIDKVLDYSCGDPAVFSLNHLPTSFKGITVDTLDSTRGFNHGFILGNNHPNGTVENVTVQDCCINGVTDGQEHNLIWLLQGEQRHILFENVRGAADVRLGLPQGNTPDPVLKDIEIRNCRYRRIASERFFDSATFVNCRRGDSLLPMASHWPSAKTWTNSAADRAILELLIPANATISRGDHIELRFSGLYADGGGAQVAVKAFGALLTMAHLIPFAQQAIDLNLRIALTGNSFTEPDNFVVTGHVTVNDTIVPIARRAPGAFNLNLPGPVRLLAWSEHGNPRDTGFFVEFASLKYVCFDE